MSPACAKKIALPSITLDSLSAKKQRNSNTFAYDKTLQMNGRAITHPHPRMAYMPGVARMDNAGVSANL